MIKLLPRGDGTYAEVEPSGAINDVTWVRDSYTEPRDDEALFDCAVCARMIEDWNLFTCMDGGEAAHQGCVTITSQDDIESSYEQRGALPGDGQDVPVDVDPRPASPGPDWVWPS